MSLLLASFGQEVQGSPLAKRKVRKAPTFRRIAPVVEPRFQSEGTVSAIEPESWCGRLSLVVITAWGGMPLPPSGLVR